VKKTALAFCFVLWSASVQAQDPAKVNPSIYKQQFENERVRVFLIEFKPGEAIGMHSHPDHLAYALTAGTLEITGADGKSQVAELKEGDTLFLPAQSHSAVNKGAKKLRALVVELKEAPKM